MAIFNFSRSDSTVLGRWWWSIDRSLLLCFLLLILFGFIMAMAATPVVAERINLDKLYFVKRHFAYIVPTCGIMFLISILNNEQAKYLSLFILCIMFIMVLGTLVFGTQIKGAKRWLTIVGLSIQPSEFVKPTFAVISAWVLSLSNQQNKISENCLIICLYLLVISPIILQPDIGMTVVITSALCGQVFLNGLPLRFVFGGVILAVISFISAYLFLPHVTARVDKFLDPTSGDNYQITKSLEAFANGGMFGIGPGEGIVKRHLPDAHADFVFSVLGEEFGVISCVVLVCIFMLIFIRGTINSIHKRDAFSCLALFGLIMQLSLQAIINMASSLHMIPTKGMTLPFVSYGGSSMLAAGFTAGLVLCFSKKRK